MASFFDRLKQNIFGITRLTPIGLESLIIDNFMVGMKESTLKNTIYYPTSFIVFLESSDFERLNQHFIGIFDDSVKEFVKILTGVIPKGHPFPHAKKWQMQFLKNSEGMLLNGQVIDLASGSVLIVSSLYPTGEEPKGSNTVVASRSKIGSVGKRFEINPAILNEISEKGEFFYETKLMLVPKGQSKESTEMPSKASLTLTSGGTFSGGMKSVGLFASQVKVCGKKGFPGGGVQIVRIEDDLVSNPHFIIYENAQDGTFMIEAQASLMLNGNNITGSTEMLPDNSLIVIANKHQLRFTIASKNKDGNVVSKLMSKIFS